MNTELVSKLGECFRLQNEVNCSVAPNWLELDHNWLRAARQEASELIDSAPWKWWKHGATADWSNIKVEIIDILHFVISSIQVSSHSNFGTIGVEPPLLQASFDGGGFLPHAHGFTKEEQILFLTDKFVGESSFIDFLQDKYTLLSIVFDMWMVATDQPDKELAAEDLLSQYVVKAALNKFRQAHGYKEGTYIKEWQGVEDNVQAFQLFDGLPVEIQNEAGLTHALEEFYTLFVED